MWQWFILHDSHIKEIPGKYISLPFDTHIKCVLVKYGQIQLPTNYYNL
jgi:hypothetical protein